ncbi:hypothetical protein AgCh_023971 [Apium graveolens]
MIQLVFREILKARIESESVVKIAKAHLSQRKIVHITRASVPPITSEHWITTGINCVKVNCDATDFGDGVGWIFWEAIVIFFSLKNIYILIENNSSSMYFADDDLEFNIPRDPELSSNGLEYIHESVESPQRRKQQSLLIL